MKSLLLILLSVVCTVSGQTFQKLGMSRMGPIKKLSFSLIKVFLIPSVLVGSISLVIGSFLWLIVLSREDLSFAYPLLSVGYILVTFISAIFFKEKVSWQRWLGVFLIFLGVALVMG